MQEQVQSSEMSKKMSFDVDAEGMTALAGKYMTFKLSKEEYGVQILNVREIIGLMHITRMPRTEKFIRGVINLRGKVIPVIDLRLKFDMDEVEATDQTVIIVVQLKDDERSLTMGIIVDEVLEVLDIPAERIEPPPTFGNDTQEADFILGVGKVESRVILLLDMKQALSSDKQEEIEVNL